MNLNGIIAYQTPPTAINDEAPPLVAVKILLASCFNMVLLSHQGGICWVARQVCPDGKVILGVGVGWGGSQLDPYSPTFSTQRGH